MDITPLYYFDDDQLVTLIEPDDRMKISLLFPVQQEPDKRDHNLIRLKNQIQVARDMLQVLGLRRPEIDRYLAPAAELTKGGRFLNLGSPGLAIYLAADHARIYQIPYVLPEVATVCPQFLITPLMPLRQHDKYYILALSQQSVRLLLATRFTVRRMDLDDVPGSLHKALRWDDPEKQLQWHTGTGTEDDGRAAIFHGHGVAAKETHKESLLRYFHLLDQGIKKILSDEEAPLLLAGVDYLLPIYRQANSYGHLLRAELVGSQEHLSDQQIHHKSWPLVQDHFQEQRDVAVMRYNELAARERVAANLTHVVSAAYQARVDTLFVSAAKHAWGHFDPESGQVTRSSQRHAGDSDLLNVATIYTLLSDGMVYTDQNGDIPGSQPVAAILRF